METIARQVVSNQTFNNIKDYQFIACNIENCIFSGNLTAEFECCNIKECDFSGATYKTVKFIKSNIIDSNVDTSKAVLDKSNIINSEDEKRLSEAE